MVPNPNFAALPIEDMNVYSYDYPYFHSDGTAPVLYELVDEFVECDFNQEQKRLCKRIVSRCFAMPHEASWRDSCGDSALHRLCQMPLVDHFTLKVAKALVQADSRLIGIQNNWQETPLHQFVAHFGLSSGSDLIRVMELVRLLSCNNRVASCRNYLGAMPLHVACELTFQGDSECEIVFMAIIKHLLNQNLMALHAKDNQGMTPLHRAVISDHGRSVHIVELLLEQLNSGSDNKATNRSRFHERKHKDLLRDLLQTLWKNNKNSVTHAQREAAALSLEWKKTLLILKSAAANEQHLVHAAINLDAPLVVVQMTAWLYPNQLSVMTDNGRLPLHLALEKSTTWHGGLQTLFKAEPRAVTARDPVTYLFPFLLAAMKQQENRDLSTIYELLRADPSVVAFAAST